MAAGRIATHFDVTRQAVSQHLRVLHDAGLVSERRDGTRRIYRARPEGLAELRAFLDEFWSERLGPSDAKSRPSTGGALRMAIASSELVEREIRIDAPPSVVFEFLTDPAKMVRWMGTEAVLEPWPGGRYYVNPSGHEPASGKVLEIIPDRRLVFSWGWEGGALPLPPGQSTVEISL